MFDPLRKIMLRFDASWDRLSNARKLERYAVLMLYIVLAVLFAIIMFRS